MIGLRMSSLALIAILAGSILSLAFASSASAQTATVTVSTDKPAYNPGDPITVSGQVSAVQPGVLVAITLIAPNGAIQIPKAVLPSGAGAFSTVISSYKVPVEGTYRLVASYGKVQSEIKIDIGKAQPAQDKGSKNCDVKKYVCVTVTKPNAVSKYMTDSGYGLKFNPGDTVTLPLWASREKSGGSYLVQSATLTVTGPGTKAFEKTYDANHFFQYWMDVQTQGIGGARFYTQKFTLASNAPGGMYTAKIVTSVPGKPQNLLQDTITFDVAGKQGKGTGVLVYMSATTAKTEVKLQSIYDASGKSGPTIARFTLDFSPHPSQGYKLITEKGWVCVDKAGMLDCAATKGPMGPGNGAVFKVNRPLDSVEWTAYDASGKVIDSGTAKK